MKSLPGEPSGSASPLIQATAHSLPEQAQALSRARAFAEPLLAGESLDTGENTLAHADAVAALPNALLVCVCVCVCLGVFVCVHAYTATRPAHAHAPSP